MPTGDELVEMWKRTMGGGAARILEVLATAYPDEVTRDDLAGAAELTPSSGTFSTYLGRLRSNGLIVDNRQARTLRAAPELFGD